MPTSKILVPIDGSPASLRAADFAIEMAAIHPDASLLLLHVWNVHALDLLGVAEAMDENWLQEAGKRGSDQALNGAAGKCETANVTFQALARSGHVAETIIQVARDEGVQFIVMGTRGLGGVEGLLLGSVTNQVIHLTEVPVTLIK